MLSINKYELFVKLAVLLTIVDTGVELPTASFLAGEATTTQSFLVPCAIDTRSFITDTFCADVRLWGAIKKSTVVLSTSSTVSNPLA